MQVRSVPDGSELTEYNVSDNNTFGVEKKQGSQLMSQINLSMFVWSFIWGFVLFVLFLLSILFWSFAGIRNSSPLSVFFCVCLALFVDCLALCWFCVGLVSFGVLCFLKKSNQGIEGKSHESRMIKDEVIVISESTPHPGDPLPSFGA